MLKKEWDHLDLKNVVLKIHNSNFFQLCHVGITFQLEGIQVDLN